MSNNGVSPLHGEPPKGTESPGERRAGAAAIESAPGLLKQGPAPSWESGLFGGSHCDLAGLAGERDKKGRRGGSGRRDIDTLPFRGSRVPRHQRKGGAQGGWSHSYPPGPPAKPGSHQSPGINARETNEVQVPTRPSPATDTLQGTHLPAQPKASSIRRDTNTHIHNCPRFTFY